MQFNYQNWSTIVYVDVPLISSDHVYPLGSNMFLQMEAILIYFQWLVVHHKVLYWAPYFSLSI